MNYDNGSFPPAGFCNVDSCKRETTARMGKCTATFGNVRSLGLLEGGGEMKDEVLRVDREFNICVKYEWSCGTGFVQTGKVSGRLKIRRGPFEAVMVWFCSIVGRYLSYNL